MNSLISFDGAGNEPITGPRCKAGTNTGQVPTDHRVHILTETHSHSHPLELI